MAQQNIAARTPGARSSFGGYRLVNTEVLLNAWRLYRVEKRLRFMDFRVYLALHEIDERRNAAGAKRRRSGRSIRAAAPDRAAVVPELLTLLDGATGRNIRAALRRLQTVGLVGFDASDASTGLSLPIVVAMHDESGKERPVVPKRRHVIVPRRVLRYLARAGSPAEAAVVLGQCMRCLFRHGKVLKSEGSCAASFVARVFEIHPRTAKRIRSELQASGWLERLVGDHWHVQAHGGRGRINLGWSPPKASDRTGPGPRVPERSPRQRAGGAKVSPPESKRSLTPQGNHAPGAAGANGVRKRMQNRSRDGIGHVAPADLRDDRRLERLFVRAASVGLVQACDADRLRFHAAAEHALAVGRRNPPGLFASIVRRGLWQVLTQGDEDEARKRLLRLRQDAASSGAPGSSETSSVRGLVAELAGRWSAQSSDAAVVTERIDGGRLAGSTPAVRPISGARKGCFRFPGRTALIHFGRARAAESCCGGGASPATSSLSDPETDGSMKGGQRVTTKCSDSSLCRSSDRGTLEQSGAGRI